jgi:hypothetical protein
MVLRGTYSALPQNNRSSGGRGPLWVKMRNTQPEQMFSGLPPEADVDRGGRHVSNVPTRDISPTSINDLVGAHEERRRDREAKRSGGPHVDDEVEARGALKR